MMRLDDREWKPCRLSSLGKVESGRDIYALERVDGDIPYITSGSQNNGIGYFVDNKNDTHDKGYIAFNRNGAVGLAFYHPYWSVMGNDCRKLHLTDADENIYVGSLHVSAEDLIRCCKENGANPSSLLCALSAKAAYHINAGKKDDVVVSLTMALKKMFGLEETISNAVRLSLSYASYDDVMNKPISAAAQKIRKDMDLQRSKDYIVSFCRLFETYQYIPQVRPRVVTYIGNFDIGDNTKHIVDFNMETEGHFVVYTIQLRDQFVFVVQYGKATEKYLNEFDRLFKEMGIRSEISSPVHTVLKDVREAVL